MQCLNMLISPSADDMVDCVAVVCVQVQADAGLMNSILAGLPGVNPEDPAFQEALRNMQGGGDSKDTDKKDSS